MTYLMQNMNSDWEKSKAILLQIKLFYRNASFSLCRIIYRGPLT